MAGEPEDLMAALERSLIERGCGRMADREKGRLIQVSAPHFTAGVEARDGRIVRAAPIVRYMVGWTGDRFAAYCRHKGWAWERVA